MVREYLKQQSERVTDFSQLREGEIYVVAHNEGYMGFIMPKVPSHKCPFVVLNGERVFEVESESDSGRIKTISSYPIDEISITHDGFGVFRPSEESELRRTLEAQLFSEETELVA